MYDYLKPGSLFSWIRKISPSDRMWARKYLQSKGIQISPYSFEDNGPNTIFPDDAIHREANSKLKNAWRQKKSRRVNIGRKSYNFILSNPAKRKLDKIAEEMHTSITGALINVIEREDIRIAEHKQELKDVKKEISQTKEKHNIEKAELAQTSRELKQVLQATENSFSLQIMRLVLSNIQLENRYSQHAPLDALKEQVLSQFNTVRDDAKNNMGPLAMRLTSNSKNAEELWQEITDSTSSTNTESQRDPIQRLSQSTALMSHVEFDFNN